MVSPWNVGFLCCNDSTSRLAIAAPLTSGTDIPSTSEYTRLPTTTFLPNCVWVSAYQASVCSGWWFIVIMQKRWSSYSVIVFPGQCLYTSPMSNSSKNRPNSRASPIEQILLMEKRKLLRERPEQTPLVLVQFRAPGSDEREAYIVHTQRTQVRPEQPSQHVAGYLQRAGVGMRLLAERVVDVHVVDHNFHDAR